MSVDTAIELKPFLLVTEITKTAVKLVWPVPEERLSELIDSYELSVTSFPKDRDLRSWQRLPRSATWGYSVAIDATKAWRFVLRFRDINQNCSNEIITDYIGSHSSFSEVIDYVSHNG